MNRADKILLWIKLVLSLVQLVAALALIGLYQTLALSLARQAAIPQGQILSNEEMEVDDARYDSRDAPRRSSGACPSRSRAVS